MVDFKPWEIPTGGEPPPLDVRYGETAGQRFVVNQSAWMLLVQRPDGTRYPLPRVAYAIGQDDIVLPPMSLVEPIQASDLHRIERDAYRAYDRRHAAELGPDGEWVRKEGPHYWHQRVLHHDRLLQLVPGGFGKARLMIGPNDGVNIEGNWCFEDVDAAWRSVLGWNGEGDPLDGWIRHIETARRRKDGTPETEYWNAAEAPTWARARLRTKRRQA